VKLSDNFYNWSDGTITYGVNFAQVDDATSFAGAIVSSISALSGGTERKRESEREREREREGGERERVGDCELHLGFSGLDTEIERRRERKRPSRE
jgi:hypothetical protein